MLPDLKYRNNPNKTYCIACNEFFDKNLITCPICGQVLNPALLVNHPDAHCYILKISTLYVNKSLRDGIIWFRQPKYYRDMYEINQDKIMGDPRECASHIDNGVCDFAIDEKEIMLFCMYKLITDENGNYEIPTEVKKYLCQLGEFVTFINIFEFMDYLNKYRTILANMVKLDDAMYYTQKYNGRLNYFSKIENYLYQNEYRLLLKDKKFLNYYTDSGNIKDCFKYHSPCKMRNIFSKPIPLEKIINSTNESQWDYLIEFS